MNENVAYLNRTAQWVHVSKVAELYRLERLGAYVIVSVSKTENGWRKVVLEVIA